LNPAGLMILCFIEVYILKHYIPYYPEDNGLAKSINKNLINIIKKLLFKKKRA